MVFARPHQLGEVGPPTHWLLYRVARVEQIALDHDSIYLARRRGSCIRA